VNNPEARRQDDAGEVMGFFEHIDQLRRRILLALIALVIASIIAAFLTPGALNFLLEPYCLSVAPSDGDCRLTTISPTESVGTYVRVTLTVGAILAMPMILYQLWAFVSPGLHPNERRYAYLFVPGATILFLVGVTFAWGMMLPAAIGFLSTFEEGIFRVDWRSNEYIPFVTSLLFWIGVSFEMPLVFLVLARLGLLSAPQLIGGWRYAIVIIAVAAAVITPTPDPFNMALVMAPLLVLYVVSIGLAAFGGAWRRRGDG
jgi:sec-independent protein translocase protein TatC